jgi:hypothetical protein
MEYHMSKTRKKLSAKTIVRIKLSEVWTLPKIYDVNAHKSEEVSKPIREFDGLFMFCAVRRDGETYADIMDTYFYARSIAHDIGSGLEFWKWCRKYLVFGLRFEAYNMLCSSDLIDHIGTVKLAHNGWIEDLYVLDRARFQAVGAFLRAKPYEGRSLNRHLSDIVQNASTLVFGTRSNKTIGEIASNIIDDANQIWEVLEFEDDQEGWKNYCLSSPHSENHSPNDEQRALLAD